MIEVITAAAFALAWFVFWFDRHQRRRADVDAAYGRLRAVHHGMVQGMTPGQATGWGQLYFSTDYTEAVAKQRAKKTRDLVMLRGIDEVLVVPTEPLARLATATPHDDLISYTTIAVANFALWRVHAFNQLARQLTDFNTAHAVEITSQNTDPARRDELAAAAMSLSLFVHLDGIGQAWAALPGGGRGWYGALIEAIGRNMSDLDSARRAHRWHWLREWPYVAVNALIACGLIAVIASAVR